MLGGWVQAGLGPAFPWGTLVVNLIGSLVLGFFVRATELGTFSPETRAFVSFGLCGAFTTFSTLSLETVVMMQAGAWSRAAIYAFGSLALGVAAVVAGFALAGPLLRL